MKHHSLALLLLVTSLMLSLALRAANTPDIQQNGAFTWHRLSFSQNVIYGPEWNLADIAPAAHQQQATGLTASHDVMVVTDPAGTIRWNLQAKTERILTLNWDFKLSHPRLRHRFLAAVVPGALSKTFTVTDALGKTQTLIPSPKLSWIQLEQVKTFTLLLTDGTRYTFVNARPTTMVLQDDSRWNKRAGYEFRFLQTDQPLSIQASCHAPKSLPIPLKTAANRTFKDDVEGDAKGGWTDQGPSNDMRVFNERQVTYRGIPFQIADEKKDGNSTIVVAGDVRNMAPAEITLNLPANTTARGLSLLHASGWVDSGHIGDIVVRYADTSVQTIPVNGGVDVGNWWVAADMPNAKIAWNSRNDSRNVGLYASSFELGGAQPVSLTFRIKSRHAIWMIAAVTLTEHPVLMPRHVPQPFTTAAKHPWYPFDYQRKIKPGSPMDFSTISIDHTPAGKFGHVVANDSGHLVFTQAPRRRLKIMGVNFCNDMIFNNSHEEARDLAKFLAAQGINSVRLHHHDDYLVDPDSPRSTDLNYKLLDQMEYLIAQLKEQGIYITFDVYTSRGIKPGDKLSAFKGLNTYDKNLAKMAFIYTEDGFENWKTFARKWLTHKNPYTGMSLAEDPVVIFANLINEDTVGSPWQHGPGSPEFRLISGLFKQHCQNNPTLKTTPTMHNPDYVDFVYRTARTRYQAMMDYLRQDLGAKFLMTSSNFYATMHSTWLRDCFDLVDDHMYQDHPMFPEKQWGFPLAYTQSCVIEGHAWAPSHLFRGRIYGKPFLVTEIDFCWPNIYRTEEGPLLGAYGALNDIDGYYRFNFSSSHWRATLRKRQIAVFESCNDPVKQLSDRIIAALLIRGDLTPSQTRISHTVSRDLKIMPPGFPTLQTSPLLNQVGVVFPDRPVPGAKDHRQLKGTPAGQRFLDYKKTQNAHSDNGQISLYPAQKTLVVSTPRTALVTLPAKASAGNALKVSNSSTFQTLAAISLDKLPLHVSRSLVILHATNTDVTGTEFADTDRRKMITCRAGDHILLRGTADLQLAVSGPRTVTAINYQGEPLGTIPATYANGTLTFKADNLAFKGGIAAYHITCK